jgi:hypothetical protein
MIARIEEQDSGFHITPPSGRGSRDLERSKRAGKSIAKFNGPDGGDALKFSTKLMYSNNTMYCHSKPLSICSMGLRQRP